MARVFDQPQLVGRKDELVAGPSSRGRHDRLTTATVGGRTDLGGAFGVLVVVVTVAVPAQIVRFI